MAFCCLCGNKANKKSRRRLCDMHLSLFYYADLAVEERIAEMDAEPPAYRSSLTASEQA